ncbi:MAG: hypothetical protein FWD64_05020 [Acidobacteriaceae bacterium]|nr:hypothetical protein [Acidobacteriaceae bacterium]
MTKTFSARKVSTAGKLIGRLTGISLYYLRDPHGKASAQQVGHVHNLVMHVFRWVFVDGKNNKTRVFRGFYDLSWISLDALGRVTGGE